MRYGTSHGLSFQHAKEFAQEVCVRAFNKGSIILRYDYILTDYLRDDLGDDRTKKGKAKRKATHFSLLEEVDTNFRSLELSAEETLVQFELVQRSKELAAVSHEILLGNALKPSPVPLHLARDARAHFLKEDSQELAGAKFHQPKRPSRERKPSGAFVPCRLCRAPHYRERWRHRKFAKNVFCSGEHAAIYNSGRRHGKARAVVKSWRVAHKK